MPFMTMICDIKNSRLIENRGEVQYMLIDMLKESNRYFEGDIASSFIITIGDEWQGLLNYPCDYMAIINFFHQRLGSVDFYCGIGIGEVTIHDFELTVNQLDGPSFYKAREAVEIAKKHNYSLVLIE